MRGIALALVSAGALAAALAPAADAAPVTEQSRLTHGGLGSLRIGMSIGEARRETGQRIRYRAFDPGRSTCGTAVLHPRSLDVSLLTTRRRIAVITVGSRGIATRAGIRVGDTIGDVRRAYGTRVRSRPNFYQPRWRDLSVREGRRKLLLRVDGRGRVWQIAAGRMPEVDYVEGCA